MRNFEDRIALVTGAAQGIGAETARQLAAHGATVAVLDLTAERCTETLAAVEATGRTGLALGADVAEEEQIEAAVARVVAELGGLDILVNNAGITRDRMLFKTSADDWDAVIRVNLRGMFLATRAAQRTMTERHYGRIVNLSSTSAMGLAGHASYGTAKAGVQGFTRTAAVELGRYGITVNAVAPGYVNTAMTEAVAARSGLTPDQLMEQVGSRLPMRRVGQPADIADAILFFAGESAGFVTGQVLYVDGGHTIG